MKGNWPEVPWLASAQFVDEQPEWPEVVELKGYTPKPGDVLFITVKKDISAATADRLHHVMTETIPGVKVVILCDGMTVQAPE